jgi:hypothetical protein
MNVSEVNPKKAKKSMKSAKKVKKSDEIWLFLMV